MNEQSKDEHSAIFLPEKIIIQEELVEASPESIDLRDLVKLQGVIRGYLGRKRAKVLISSNRNTRVKQSKKPANPEVGTVESLYLLEKIPDYSSPVVTKLQKKLGIYLFDKRNDGNTRISRGPILMSNKAVYIGEWNQSDQRDGFGMQIWNNGSLFEGLWKSNAMVKGRLIFDHGEVYEGEFFENQACGNGTFYSLSESIYSGQWLRDLRHGLGHESSVNGDIYKGEFYEDKKNGKGLIVFNDTSEYDGDFSDDHIHGFGKFSWADGREYLGEFAFGKMEGKGTFVWPDGRRYEGEYLNDQKHGFGRFFTSEKNMYEGFWKHGKKHGTGIQTSENGLTRKGQWLEGKRIKWVD
jgi:hypothetical protein